MNLFIKIILTFFIIFNFSFQQKPAIADAYVKTIAVLDFENNSGLISLDNLKKGLSDSMVNSLARYKRINIVERSRLKDAMSEVAFGQSGFTSPETAAKIGKITGSNYVLLGSVVRIGDVFEVGVRVVDVESSKVILGRSVRGPNEEAIFKSIDYLSLETANSLGEAIDKSVMENARREAESFRGSNNLSTYLWIGGGILATGLIAGGIALALGLGPKQESNQNVCIGSDCDTKDKKLQTLNFSFGWGI